MCRGKSVPLGIAQSIRELAIFSSGNRIAPDHSPIYLNPEHELERRLKGDISASFEYLAKGIVEDGIPVGDLPDNLERVFEFRLARQFVEISGR